MVNFKTSLWSPAVLASVGLHFWKKGTRWRPNKRPLSPVLHFHLCDPNIVPSRSSKVNWRAQVVLSLLVSWNFFFSVTIPAYSVNRLYAIYFIVFLVIGKSRSTSVSSLWKKLPLFFSHRTLCAHQSCASCRFVLFYEHVNCCDIQPVQRILSGECSHWRMDEYREFALQLFNFGSIGVVFSL